MLKRKNGHGSGSASGSKSASGRPYVVIPVFGGGGSAAGCARAEERFRKAAAGVPGLGGVSRM